MAAHSAAPQTGLSTQHAWTRASPGAALHLFSAVATKSHLDASFAPGDALVFGKESVGLSTELCERFPDRLVGIPTLGAVRSLNLANAVGILTASPLPFARCPSDGWSPGNFLLSNYIGSSGPQCNDPPAGSCGVSPFQKYCNGQAVPGGNGVPPAAAGPASIATPTDCAR